MAVETLEGYSNSEMLTVRSLVSEITVFLFALY